MLLRFGVVVAESGYALLIEASNRGCSCAGFLFPMLTPSPHDLLSSCNFLLYLDLLFPNCFFLTIFKKNTEKFERKSKFHKPMC